MSSSSGGQVKMSMVTDINKAERDVLKMQQKYAKLEAELKKLKGTVQGVDKAAKKKFATLNEGIANSVRGLVGQGGLLLAWHEINAAVQHNIDLINRSNFAQVDLGEAQRTLVTKLGKSVTQQEAEQSVQNIEGLVRGERVTQFTASELTQIASEIASATSTGADPTERLRAIENITSLADSFAAFPSDEVGVALAAVADVSKQFKFPGQTEEDRRGIEQFVGGQISELISQGRFSDATGVAGFAKIFAQVVAADDEFKKAASSEEALNRLNEDFREAFAQDVAFGGGAVDPGNQETATALANLNSFLRQKFLDSPGTLADGSFIDTPTERRRAITEGFRDAQGRVVSSDEALLEVMSGVSSRFAKDQDSVNARAKMRVFLEQLLEGGRPVNQAFNDIFDGNIVDNIDLNDPGRSARNAAARIGIESGLPAVRDSALRRTRRGQTDVVRRDRASQATDALFGEDGLLKNDEQAFIQDRIGVTNAAFSILRNFMSDEDAAVGAMGIRRTLRGGPLGIPFVSSSLTDQETSTLKELQRIREVNEKLNNSVRGSAAAATNAAQGQRESR